jgi:hypothetical protein
MGLGSIGTGACEKSALKSSCATLGNADGRIKNSWPAFAYLNGHEDQISLQTMAKYPALLEAELKLLEALKNECLRSGEYTDAKINKDDLDAPFVALTARDGTTQNIAAAPESVSGELCVSTLANGDIHKLHQLDKLLRRAYLDAFGRNVPSFPNATY